MHTSDKKPREANNIGHGRVTMLVQNEGALPRQLSLGFIKATSKAEIYRNCRSQ
ncbi:unnamed protein product [Sphenostylis stenocarpa]|uniref:Uncharacterized protein n=1 Tax=Sphenostylis stenocarpa TaxID=92480 RepID=A0AA86S2Z6_9FABA|nr:unnamed protein product [Sphenostylis stenocarpa]